LPNQRFKLDGVEHLDAGDRAALAQRVGVSQRSGPTRDLRHIRCPINGNVTPSAGKSALCFA
jgi:hypothetical protein